MEGNSQSPSRAPYLLYNVNIINVHDGSLQANKAVRIEQDKIHSIGDFKALRKNIPSTNHIDGNGKFLIPGLWDMHVHLEGAELIPDN